MVVSGWIQGCSLLRGMTCSVVPWDPGEFPLSLSLFCPF